MPITQLQTQVVVIGAGPGGYAAAFRAADLGLQVTLVDSESNPGGVCLYKGCIPSKALLHAAKVISESREAKSFGLHFEEPKINLDELRSWKNDIIKKLTGGLGQLAKQRKVRFVTGLASFLSPQILRVLKKEGEEEHIQFESAIVATGSHPISVSDWPIDSPKLLNSTTALDLTDIPKRLLVVGGGYIGLELGSVYAALGSQVSVVEMAPGLLAGADSDLVAPLKKLLDHLFENIFLKTRVENMKDTPQGMLVSMSADDKKFEETFDKVLVSIGRKPNSVGLGLKEAGVEVDAKGFIKVNEQRRTASPSIYAIGDVAGEPMLAHKATHEGCVAAEAIAGHKAVFDPQAIPAVIFTDPEIAWCGLTENEAKAKGIEVKVSKFPWAASGRSLTLGRTEGLTKLIIDSSSERILGVGLVGPGAGDLIAEGVLAIEMGSTAMDMALTIHPHPTLSETYMEAAEMFYGKSIHIYKPVKK